MIQSVGNYTAELREAWQAQLDEILRNGHQLGMDVVMLDSPFAPLVEQDMSAAGGYTIRLSGKYQYCPRDVSTPMGYTRYHTVDIQEAQE